MPEGPDQRFGAPVLGLEVNEEILGETVTARGQSTERRRTTPAGKLDTLATSPTAPDAHHFWKDIMELLWEITGWAGAALILSAYLGMSMGWLKAGKSFQMANLLGACAFIVNGAFHEAWPSVTTNIAWFLISAVALFRMRSAARRPVAAADTAHVQFPGIPDTTGQLAVVEVFSGSAPDDVDAQGPSPSSRGSSRS